MMECSMKEIFKMQQSLMIFKNHPSYFSVFFPEFLSSILFIRAFLILSIWEGGSGRGGRRGEGGS